MILATPAHAAARINGLVKFCNHLHHGLRANMLIQVPAAGPQDDLPNVRGASYANACFAPVPASGGAPWCGARTTMINLQTDST
jgi:hypothetical protein